MLGEELFVNIKWHLTSTAMHLQVYYQLISGHFPLASLIKEKVFIFQCFESQNCYVTDCILTISINGCSQTFCTFFNTGLDIKGIVYYSK